MADGTGFYCAPIPSEILPRSWGLPGLRSPSAWIGRTSGCRGRFWDPVGHADGWLELQRRYLEVLLVVLIEESWRLRFYIIQGC
ncbi:hypothetical protein NDU88_009233 [Pleurodeles waltl]|uniref:Uncharacterized protein n=1 Tax=Pleurodeles waltl TaxID=8319 RepID=A0AAV7P1U6_PLEWA|nr:hypothetical protein NDU88_009233 [Pleurodeles waltl]